MEEKDIDILIEIIEEIVNTSYYLEYSEHFHFLMDDDIINSFAIYFKYDEPNFNKVIRFLDKFGVEYYKGEINDEDYGLIIEKDSGRQIINDLVKENSKQLTKYIKTKDKKTIGKFALIFGENLDDDFLKEIVESKETWDEKESKVYREYGLNNTQRGKVLCYVKDTDYKKKVLENNSEYKLDDGRKYPLDILISINDIDYIKKWIDEGLVSGLQLVKLLEFVNDSSYIKKILCKGNCYFDRDNVMELVQFFKNPEITKYVIENAKKYDLDSSDIRELLGQFNDIEFIKQLIENAKKYDLDSSDIRELLRQVNDSEFIKQLIENAKKYDLNSSDIRELLRQVNDSEFTKQVIENAEKYDLNINDIKYILISVSSRELAKYAIENAKKYNLESSDIRELLSQVKDIEFIKQVIENAEKYNLNRNDIKYILRYASSRELAKYAIENGEKYDLNRDDIKYILSHVRSRKLAKPAIENANKYDLDSYDIQYLLSQVNDIEFTKQVIENAKKYGLRSSDIIDLLIQVKDIEFTKQVIENAKKCGLYSSDILDLLRRVNDIEFTKQVIENAKKCSLYSSDIRDLLLFQVKDIEFTKQVIENAEKCNLCSSDILELLRQVNDSEFIKKVIENANKYGLASSDILYLLSRVKDIEFTKQVIENAKKYDLDSSDIRDLLFQVEDIEFTKQVIENAKKCGLYSSDIRDLLIQVNDIEFVKKILKNRNEYELSDYDAVDVIIETNLIPKEEDLKEIIFSNKEISKFYRRKGASIQFIKEYLSEFIEIEEANIEPSELLKMAERNEDILKGNFDILAEKYINILGIEKINQISCYSSIVDGVLKLSDGELELLGKILDRYMNITKGDEWTPLANRILDNIGSYRDLVSNIEGKENVNIDKLIPILIHSNDFNIKTMEDLENFKEIKIKKCEKLINGETIEEKQKGLLLKIFGQGMRETKEIIKKFGKDIDEIGDEDLKAYIKSLQEILQTKNPNVLEKIFNQVGEIETINPLLMERMLKTEYWKLYNKDLFTIENAEKLPEGENLYSAGTDFKMIITSVGAYCSNIITDYQKDWNRPSIGSQHFCASYIRNDMLGHAPVTYICYGFYEMKEDSLMLSGSEDICSSGVSFESISRKGAERYLAPNNQIANTLRYNEMDFRRIQGGEKKQPDYIVVFRKKGKIKNMDTAEKASQDFGGLPIVVIDVDECLAVERKMAEELYEEYKATGSPQVKAKLQEKLRNNRVTDFHFCRDIDMDSIIENQTEQERTEEARISMEDLGEIYAEVSGMEREEEIKRIRMLYKEIRNIKEKEDNNDAR